MSSVFSRLQVRPASPRGGILFAFTDFHQKVVELGLALTPVRGGLQSILLYYTDREEASHSHKAAAFSVPDMTDQWTRFTVSLTHDTTGKIQIIHSLWTASSLIMLKPVHLLNMIVELKYVLYCESERMTHSYNKVE